MFMVVADIVDVVAVAVVDVTLSVGRGGGEREKSSEAAAGDKAGPSC